jgi:EAL domain-containing protein (putative c-di-GMP-specific phosphodiesterase class I)
MRSILAMMGDLDLTVVVEGVETAETADQLLKLGGTLAQGIYFGHAKSLDATMKRLREHGDVAVVAD